MSRFRKIIFSLAIIMYCFPIIGYASDNLETEIVIKYNEIVSEDEMFITNGYTDKGVYFEVFGKQCDTRALDGILVTRTFIYEGQIQPESTLRVKEYINGEVYAGNLNLTAFYYNYNENITEAKYQGILYKSIQ